MDEVVALVISAATSRSSRRHRRGRRAASPPTTMATTQLRDTTNRFLTLDRDALACVLGHLDASTLANSAASCKLFRDTTKSSALWRRLCVAERGSLAQLPAGIDWRKMAATIFPPERPSSLVSDYTLLVDFTHHDHPQLFTIETSDAFTDPAYRGEPAIIAEGCQDCRIWESSHTWSFQD